MASVDFLSVDTWMEHDLDNLPKQEDEIHEYKSSLTPFKELNKKICKAASAFWNSGGGYFIVGVNDSGIVDGGIPRTVNTTSIRDWIDQILFNNVHPLGEYGIQLVEPQKSDSRIKQGSIVLVIGFAESAYPPHMYAGKYYIRAGALSVPATHFIVEALWSRRGSNAPGLRAIVRYNPLQSFKIELGILALNDSDAVDVHISFDRAPKFIRRLPSEVEFSRTIPVINRENSFYMDISLAAGEFFEDDPFKVMLDYHDIAGQRYSDEQEISLMDSLPPYQPSQDQNVEAIDKSLKTVARGINKLVTLLERMDRRNTESSRDE